MTRLSEDEVARRAGATVERVRALVELGIVRPSGDAEAPYTGGDALRVQLVEELERSGVSASSVADAIRRGVLSLGYLDRFPGPSPRSDPTYEEVCEAAGLPFDLLDQIYTAFGLPRPRRDEPVRADDLRIISGLPVLFQAGLGEPEVLRAARMWGDAPRRVAEHQVYEFHELIEEPFRRRGLTDAEVVETALTTVGVRVIPFCEALGTWLYRRHFEAYATAHRLGHVETALQAAGLYEKPAAHPEACAFADLSGYTRLTEELGDRAARDIALHLAELMQEVAAAHRGRAVKMIGDAAHFQFPEPGDAVLGSLAFVDGARARGLPPAHVGVNAGPMIYTDGDYYGTAVNVAARIATVAGPGEVLVGEPVVEHTAREDVRFEWVGARELKGIARPVRLYRAVRAVERSSARAPGR